MKAVISLLSLPIALAAGAASALAQAPDSAAPSARPNIIIVLTDDQGYGDLGFTGNPIVHTPNIDAMAKRSATLSEFYVCPVCSPTRACLMTGRYNYRGGIVDTFMGRSMLNPAEVTMAKVFKEGGYTTGIFGKWHLGDCYPMRPIDKGFDEALVIRGGGLAQASDPVKNQMHYTNPYLVHNGELVATHGYCTDVYFNGAMKFIDQARAEGKPFFVYIATNCPHRPVDDCPMDLYEKYRKMDLTPMLLGHLQDADYLARVYAMEENIDQNVGRLQEKLKRDGLYDNTIVIYFCDNGPDSYRYVGPFRGKKTEVFEGGVRSPFIMQWPARLKAGATTDHLTAHIDVMPSLLDAAGIPVPDGLDLDGRSFLPLLEGRPVDWSDRFVITQGHRGNAPVRYNNFEVRTEDWKLLHPTGYSRDTMKEGVPYELYDIRHDRGEENNVYADHPEVVRRLMADYDSWFTDVSHSHPNNWGPPRIIVGTDHETRTVLTPQDWRVPATGKANGKWMLHFEGDWKYDVYFRWIKTVGPGTLHLKVGSQDATVDLPTATDRAWLKGIEIGPGDAELTAFVKTAAKNPQNGYHVVLLRKERAGS